MVVATRPVTTPPFIPRHSRDDHYRRQRLFGVLSHQASLGTRVGFRKGYVGCAGAATWDGGRWVALVVAGLKPCRGPGHSAQPMAYVVRVPRDIWEGLHAREMPESWLSDREMIRIRLGKTAVVWYVMAGNVNAYAEFHSEDEDDYADANWPDAGALVHTGFYYCNGRPIWAVFEVIDE